VPAHVLRRIAEQCILQHVDVQRLDVLRVAEESERQVLIRLAGTISA
jgi:hypothetical protein